MISKKILTDYLQPGTRYMSLGPHKTMQSYYHIISAVKFYHITFNTAQRPLSHPDTIAKFQLEVNQTAFSNGIIENTYKVIHLLVRNDHHTVCGTIYDILHLKPIVRYI